MIRLLPLLLLASSPALAAAPVDCRSTRLESLSLVYRTTAVFPAKSDLIMRDFLNTKPVQPIKVCGLTFTEDRKKQTLTVKADRPELMNKAFGGALHGDAGFHLEVIVRYPFDLRLDDLYFLTKSGRLSYEGLRFGSQDATVGVRLNNGPLQPLYFENTPSDVMVPPNTTIVDVYIQSQEKAVPEWQRVNFNMKTSTVTLYKKFAFPAK